MGLILTYHYITVICLACVCLHSVFKHNRDIPRQDIIMTANGLVINSPFWVCDEYQCPHSVLCTRKLCIHSVKSSLTQLVISLIGK